jgi:hypothetical protein
MERPKRYGVAKSGAKAQQVNNCARGVEDTYLLSWRSVKVREPTVKEAFAGA